MAVERMAALAGRCSTPTSPALPLLSTLRVRSRKARRATRLAARLGGEHPVSPLEAALWAASLRFQETHRPDPLIIDPYAGCFLPSTMNLNNMEEQSRMPKLASSPCYYSLATKFIDDELLRRTSTSDELRQVVLLTDGMDTRPYRLNWPRSSVIYDVCPEEVSKVASQRLKEFGAKILKTCVLVHVPLESADLRASLCEKGFNGNKPSVWALQGPPLTTLAKLNDILFVVSSLAMKGSIFMGELPGWLMQTESEATEWSASSIEKLFMKHGFRVDMIDYDEVARNLSVNFPTGEYENILFVAEQLQLSDAQMERWRAEFQRLEEEGDEEGFEEP